MITFLKLGGSLITEKDKPRTIRTETIQRIGIEIRTALNDNPEIKLILGHGSGSFGHIPAQRYKTRDGVHSSEEWLGFAEVSAMAAALNYQVTAILRDCGLPVISFSPMSAVKTDKRIITEWDLTSIVDSLQNHLIPMIYGDTIFDTSLGGTILSTEELFRELAKQAAGSSRILLSGLEKGIWQDYPKKESLINNLNIRDFQVSDPGYIMQSEFPDVTGGMQSKVNLMGLLLTEGIIHEVQIFSGEIPGNISAAILGKHPGTRLFRS